MSKNAMAGAVTLCGVGLCMIGGAALLPSGPAAHAAVVTTSAAAAAIASTAATQAGPTIVWYGTYGGNYGQYIGGALLRAWSDGTVEMKKIEVFLASSGGNPCSSSTPCSSPWIVISSPTQGFRAAADINADELIDGADLASILGNWGDAPRVPFPSSDCPLNLINP
jgi:hypothetical protein